MNVRLFVYSIVGGSTLQAQRSERAEPLMQILGTGGASAVLMLLAFLAIAITALRPDPVVQHQLLELRIELIALAIGGIVFVAMIWSAFMLLRQPALAPAQRAPALGQAA